MKPTRGPVLGMILKGYPRISETFISNEIGLLEARGFRIHIFSMRHPRESFTHPSIERINASVTYLPQTLLKPLPILLYHNLRLALKAPQPYRQAMAMALRRFRRTRKSATLKHLFQAGYLVHRCLPGTGVVHLHAHFAHSPTSVALFASKLSGIPFSFTAHAKDIYTSNRRQLREKIETARFVVTCTRYNKAYLTGLLKEKNSSDVWLPDACNGSCQGKIPRRTVHTIYHGIDLELFNQRQDLPEHFHTLNAPFRILTVARLTPKKGLPTIYKALRCLKDQGVRFEHTLIGDGDDRDDILNLIKALDLQETVRWIGTQPHQIVLDYYRRSHLFVLGCQIAANGDRDGIPNVLVESMAMGLPVVATRVSAIPELVENEHTGLLVEPGRPREMAAAILRLLQEEPLRRRIIPAARRRVEADFNNSVLVNDLAAVYRSAIPALCGADA